MPRHRLKRLQRAFPWRETFLAALRREPQVKLAAKAAGISRNTVYTHFRKDGRFRRQWELALVCALEARGHAHYKRLEADPKFQRSFQRGVERMRLALQALTGQTDVSSLLDNRLTPARRSRRR